MGTSEDHTAPEVAQQNYPELATGPDPPEPVPHAHPGPPSSPSQHPYPYPYPHHHHQPLYHQDAHQPKPETPLPASHTPVDSTAGRGHHPAAPPTAGRGPSRRRALALSSCAGALLVAAVIGLAVGTGVEADRARRAESRLASLVAAAPTGFDALDRGCTDTPEQVNGTTYRSFSLLGDQAFTVYCNLDTPHGPLYSLFTADFDTCMDACSAWTLYTPGRFGSSINTTCAAVSFIPLWTSKANATTGTAPGNCYLKPGPQDPSALKTPNIGTEVHAGLLAGA
ncbi:hypothetical protein P8C59_008539 [Phyllachora maydis]|uniref:Uncharacterized protein n=1 Tax=Phyllachora maydis TaxID=1825666 RepID=A0AAD9ICG5_9PEZI|nr:hypothetical protein P8C59_008539 [Phyllachora maydis]